MDKVCTLMATCLETCILWPYGDLRFFRRPVCIHGSNWNDEKAVRERTKHPLELPQKKSGATKTSIWLSQAAAIRLLEKRRKGEKKEKQRAQFELVDIAFAGRHIA